MIQHLYRLFDAKGRLLYIGVSRSALVRLTQHQDRQPWADQIRRVEIEAHAVTRHEIEALERERIAAECPAYNVKSNPAPAAGATAYRTLFRCDYCSAPADWVQSTNGHDAWESVCNRCDTTPAHYHIRATELATVEAVVGFYFHVQQKVWHDAYSFAQMLERSGIKITDETYEKHRPHWARPRRSRATAPLVTP